MTSLTGEAGEAFRFDAAAVGSGCIAERRALDALAKVEPLTPFLRFGETVTLEARAAVGDTPLFGRLHQRVVRGASAGR